MSTCLPVPLNSCSMVWSDPSATLPRGRLEGHVRLHPTGGLTEACDTDECVDGGRGLAICLRGGDLTAPSAPPACDTANVAGYENPLRLDSDGCLWIRYTPPPETTCTSAGAQSVPVAAGARSGNLGEAITHTVTNSSCSAVTVRRSITVIGAAIESPPPVVATNGDETPAEVRYTIDVGGTRVPILGACTGNCPVTSTTVELDPIDLAAAESVEIVVQPMVEVIAPSGERFLIDRGRVKICTTVEYPMTEEVG